VLRDWALRVVPGIGVVSRSDSTALIIADASAVDVTQRLLGAIAAHEARITSGPVSSRQLIRDIATVFAEVEVLPPFALVADEGEGIALLLHGDLSAVIRSVDGSVEEISGRMSQTWVDRILTDPLEELCLGPRSDSDGDIPFDLQVGVVPGAGIAFTKGPVSGVAPRREPVRRAEDDSVSSVPPPPAPRPAPEVEESPESVPVAAPPPDSVQALDPLAPAVGEAVIVKGVMCTRGHFNNPSVSYCSVCGVSMMNLTLRAVDGPRPPLGVFVLADGTVVSVDQDMVIGREPESHPDVIAGLAKPVVIDDPNLSMSRAHAVVRLINWNVTLCDNGSSNGTSFIPPDSESKTRLFGSEAVTIKVGTKLVLGDYMMTFNSSLH
jgi:FHA domain